MTLLFRQVFRQVFRRSAKSHCLILLLLSIGVGCSHNHVAPSVQLGHLSDFNTDQTLMVVIKDPRSERHRRGLTTPGYSTAYSYADDPALDRASKALADKYSLNLLAQWPLRNLPVLCLVVEEPSDDVIKALQADAKVEWVQAFNQFSTQTTSQPAFTEFKPMFADTAEKGAGVTVAVIDTSVDADHPSLKGSMLRQQNFAGSTERIGSESHGTAVVGLIAAQPQAGTSMLGIARDAKVEVLRACWQASDEVKGRCNTLTLALALDRAVDLSPQILNLSITGPADPVLEKLIEKLLASGTLVVAAFDEALHETQRFPRHRAGVAYAFGTNGDASGLPLTGAEALLLTAPRHALSLTPAAGYDLVSGHSVAAPQVSGLAARLMASKPRASRDEILAELSHWLRPR
ncbi:MAG: S8 family serine peptidase [Pseudomonadota bacterium]